MIKDLERKPFIQKHYRFQWEEAQEKYVLLYPEGVIQLNEAAGLILNLCNKENTVNDIINKLTLEFGDHSIKQDVLDFLNEAFQSKWIDYD